MLKYLTRENLRKWRGKTALLRVDLNIESGQEEDAYRLGVIIPTIKLLLKNGSKVLLLSHRGRPSSARRRISNFQFSISKQFSLKPIVRILEKYLRKKIIFIPYQNLGQVRHVIKSSKSSIFCLENLRFWPGETQNNPAFAKKLAALGDFYVNEAFAASHRKNASISLLPRLLPHYAGLWFAKELENLNLAMRKFKRPLTLIVGGAKAVDKLGVINYFLNRADWILLGGGPANTFFKALGLDIQDSVFDLKALPLIKKYLTNQKIILPTDVKIKHRKILDIGARTTDEFINIVGKSRTIIWNGPLGLFEEKGFEHGSYKLAKAVAKNKGFTLVGGGETTTIILKLGLKNKIKFISTGGGAMLDYLSGKKLPGIEAIK